MLKTEKVSGHVRNCSWERAWKKPTSFFRLWMSVGFCSPSSLHPKIPAGYFTFFFFLNQITNFVGLHCGCIVRYKEKRPPVDSCVATMTLKELDRKRSSWVCARTSVAKKNNKQRRENICCWIKEIERWHYDSSHDLLNNDNCPLAEFVWPADDLSKTSTSVCRIPWNTTVSYKTRMSKWKPNDGGHQSHYMVKQGDIKVEGIYCTRRSRTSCDGGGHTNMFWDAYSILLFLVLTEYLNMLLYGERNSVDRMKRTTWGFCSCSLQSKTIRVCGRVRTWDSWKRKCIPTQYARIV